MNEKTFRALVEAGAIKRVRVVADGARFHVEADTPPRPMYRIRQEVPPEPGDH